MTEWISWIKDHYKLIVGKVIPVIAGILGKKLINKTNQIKGDSNNTLTSDGSINNSQSFNPNSQTAGNNAVQVSGDHNQFISFDRESIFSLAKSFNETMFPHAEAAFRKLNSNSQSFMATLNSNLAQLAPEELEKFSEADVQIALHNAIKGSARTDSKQVHKTLARLVCDRVQKPKRIIAELAINESIEITAKLDVTLIKILAMSFIFSRTKYMSLLNEEQLIGRLTLISQEFQSVELSQSKFEYLEALSCGTTMKFIQNDLIGIISSSYPHLFLKKFSSQQVESISLLKDIREACFIPTNNETFQLHPHVGLFLFEDAPIMTSKKSLFSPSCDAEKERLKAAVTANKLSSEEIKTQLLNIPEFENILKFWNENSFSSFFLTAVGIAIGRAYLEQRNFGNFDINVWIN